MSEMGVSRRQRRSRLRSFNMTSAARPTRSIEIPWAMRAMVPAEQGTTAIASYRALPAAKGGRPAPGGEAGAASGLLELGARGEPLHGGDEVAVGLRVRGERAPEDGQRQPVGHAGHAPP